MHCVNVRLSAEETVCEQENIEVRTAHSRLTGIEAD